MSLKKSLVLLAILLVLSVSLALWAAHYLNAREALPVQTRVVTITHTINKTPPIYHIGEAQAGVTLTAVYPYDYQNLRAGSGATPPTVHLMYFAVTGADQLAGHTQVLTADGTYLVSDGPTTIPACGGISCIGYIAVGKLTAFYYQGLRWEL